MGVRIRKTFTLIETVVVVSVIGLMLPVIFSIFFLLLKQQTKIERLSIVKREGDYIINLVENKIRDNAVLILSNNAVIPPDSTNKKCDTDLSTYTSNTGLYFLDKNDLWFGYLINSNRLLFSSSGTSDININSLKTLITNFSISCSRTNVFSAPSVFVSFDICYDDGVDDCNPTQPEEISSLHYQLKIKLRNF